MRPHEALGMERRPAPGSRVCVATIRSQRNGNISEGARVLKVDCEGKIKLGDRTGRSAGHWQASGCNS